MIAAIILAYIRGHWQTLVAAVCALAVVVAFGLHERHVQRDKDATVIAGLKAQIVADQGALTAWVQTGKQWQAAQAANDATLQAQRAAGQAALAQVRKDATAHAKALTDALARQERAYAGNACAAQPLPDGVE